MPYLCPRPPPTLVRAESLSGLKRLLNRLPSAVFEKSMPGRRFTLGDRATTYVKLGLEYSLGEPLGCFLSPLAWLPAAWWQATSRECSPVLGFCYGLLCAASTCTCAVSASHSAAMRD